MKDIRVLGLLGALRNFNDYTMGSGRLSTESLATLISNERLLADLVMFNLGWYAARDVDGDLRGSAATEAVLPLLVRSAELANELADATKRYEDANAKLVELDNKPGRRKGSYKEWHFEPGYSVVVAMIELEPKKKVADHIRWAVKEGWLDGDIEDKKHRRRIELIQERQALEERNRVKALGDNVVSLAGRKKHKNKQR
jgi:hypothetical protein